MESKIFFTKNNFYFKAESTNLKPVFVELKNLNFLDIVVYVKSFQYKRMDLRFQMIYFFGKFNV